jgi:hypothetical protein
VGLVCTTLTSCALFNPYISTTDFSDTADGQDGYSLSSEMRQRFENNARALAYWQSGSTVAIAGLLGLGAYKGVTSGGSHQIAALAAGGAVVYGTSSALYRPTTEQIYIAGTSALLCIDKQYRGFNPKIGLQLYTNLAVLDEGEAGMLEETFNQAYSIAVKRENQYKANVIDIGVQVNSIIAGQQPSAEQSYAHVSGAITAGVKPPVTAGTPDESPKLASELSATEWALTSGTLGEIKQAKNAKAIVAAKVALNSWIKETTSLNDELGPKNSEQCLVAADDAIAVTGVSEEGIEELEIGSSRAYPIVNTTGRLAAFVKAPRASEQGSITAKITTENNLYFVEVTAVAATTSPAVVYITDYGKGRSTKGFQVSVKPQAPEQESE